MKQKHTLHGKVIKYNFYNRNGRIVLRNIITFTIILCIQDIYFVFRPLLINDYFLQVSFVKLLVVSYVSSLQP